MKSAKHFNRLGVMQDGINTTVREFLNRAKDAQKDVLRFKKQYEAGVGWAFDGLLSARSERGHWLWAAKLLLYRTTTGVVHFKVSERRCHIICENMRRERELLKPSTAGLPVATP